VCELVPTQGLKFCEVVSAKAFEIKEKTSLQVVIIIIIITIVMTIFANCVSLMPVDQRHQSHASRTISHA